MQLRAYYGVTFKVMNDLLIIKEETEFISVSSFVILFKCWSILP